MFKCWVVHNKNVQRHSYVTANEIQAQGTPMCVCVRVCAFMCLCVCVGMLDGYCAICVTLQSLLQVTQLNMVHAFMGVSVLLMTYVPVLV